jgi:hypothetical protein
MGNWPTKCGRYDHLGQILIQKEQCVYIYGHVGKEEKAIVAAEDPILKVLVEKEIKFFSTKSTRVPCHK